MDRFSFFFAFYGLILGLAVAELLGGFAGMVRAHALKKLEAQTALTALLTFVLIVATWVDTYTMERSITLNFGDLWPPILLATFYYLAAAVIFPRERQQYSHLVPGARPAGHHRLAHRPDPDLHGALLAVGRDRPHRDAAVRLLKKPPPGKPPIENPGRTVNLVNFTGDAHSGKS